MVVTGKINVGSERGAQIYHSLNYSRSLVTIKCRVLEPGESCQLVVQSLEHRGWGRGTLPFHESLETPTIEK